MAGVLMSDEAGNWGRGYGSCVFECILLRGAGGLLLEWFVGQCLTLLKYHNSKDTRRTGMLQLK